MKNARIVMLVFLVLVLLVALVSCSVDAGSGTTDAGNTGGGTHTHTHAVAWTSDADYHWHAATCGHADEVKDKAAHTYENGACTVCGRAEPVHKLPMRTHGRATRSTTGTRRPAVTRTR